jgi:hypothetical protein
MRDLAGSRHVLAGNNHRRRKKLATAGCHFEVPLSVAARVVQQLKGDAVLQPLGAPRWWK